MNELSPTARALLARAKVASTPGSAEAAKVMASLSAALPSSGLATTAAAKVGLGAGTGASGLAQVSTVKLLIAFVAAVGTGVVGTSVVRRELSSPPVASSSADRAGSGGEDSTALAGAGLARRVEGSPPADPSSVPRNVGSSPGDRTADPSSVPRDVGSSPAGGPADPSSLVESPTRAIVPRALGVSPAAGPATPSSRSINLPTSSPPGALTAPRALGASPADAPSRTDVPHAGGSSDALADSPHPDPLPRGERETGPAKATVDPCDLNAELSTLRHAQALLSRTPSEAFEVLEAWQRDCPRGALSEERLAVRALALCAQSKREAGRALLVELRTRFPTSPALERVDRQCAGP